MDIYEQITKMADEIAPELVAQRRDFHKFAEKGWFEMRTSSIIARKLTEMGYEVSVGDQVCKKDARMGVPSDEELEEQYERAVAQGADPEFVKYTKGGMTGVIGILRCGEGPTVAMRFDIDALGVFEEKDKSHRPACEGFGSVNEGFMHACGHDGHATIGLGVAKVLMSIKDSLHGTMKLIFQPAEEGVRGAKSIVENGHLDGVDYLIGSHVSDKAADDPAVVIPGSHGSLATTKYDVFFHGVCPCRRIPGEGQERNAGCGYGYLKPVRDPEELRWNEPDQCGNRCGWKRPERDRGCGKDGDRGPRRDHRNQPVYGRICKEHH